MSFLFILFVGIVGTCAAQSVDLREIPNRVNPKALEAFNRFRAAYAEFLRTHPNGTFASGAKKERILNPPDIEHEIRLTPLQTIRFRGYPGEEHTHQTEDKYINTLFRIPYGRAGPDYNPIGSPRPVAYLQHGILDTGFTWINNPPHQSLGYLLADAGFDVWIGNVRGNTFSRAHVSLDPDWDQKFWRFSWDHMARYDLTAAFDYIKSRTGQAKLFYTGHSMGTTMGFAGFSKYPELAARVKVFAALAPVAKVGNIRGPLAYIAPFADIITGFLDLFGIGEMIADGPLLQFLKSLFCNQITSVFGCESILWLFCGWSDRNINTTRVPVFMAKTPGGTSVQNVLHFGQNVNNDRFRMFDYGYDKNMNVYGQSKPPDYDLTKFPVKTLLFWSESDWLAGRLDVDWLKNKLPPSQVLLERHLPNYPHLDFVWAHNANDLIYRDIIRIFKENL